MTDEPAGNAPDLSRFRLKRPCKHCPFRNDETRIRFRCRDRAVEIEEQAYRRGFLCHETADYVDDPEGERDGYVFGDDSSFCIGYVILQSEGQRGRGAVARHRQRRTAAERARTAPGRLVGRARVRDRRGVLRGQREPRPRRTRT